MGNRLSRIYTRTGDTGETGLGDGQRVAKDSLRVESFGTVDELNSAIGVLRAAGVGDGADETLANIQQRLFDLGGELCIPGTQVITPERVTELEELLDACNSELPPLRDFVLPGGTPAAAACHLARAVCRRAERRVCALAREESVNPDTIRYLNRLSDFLFVFARTLNREARNDEVLWTGGKLSRDD